MSGGGGDVKSIYQPLQLDFLSEGSFLANQRDRVLCVCCGGGESPEAACIFSEKQANATAAQTN